MTNYEILLGGKFWNIRAAENYGDSMGEGGIL